MHTTIGCNSLWYIGHIPIRELEALVWTGPICDIVEARDGDLDSLLVFLWLYLLLDLLLMIRHRRLS